MIGEELILAIGDFSENSLILKLPIINNYMDTLTKPLQKVENKDMVAQIANIKSANCFLQRNSPNITLANKYSCMVFWRPAPSHRGIKGLVLCAFNHSYSTHRIGW